MAWTETDRTVLRHILGFSAIFIQADLRLETAITAVQATVDGGTRPDNSTELQIRGWIADFATIETNIKQLWTAPDATRADEVNVDALRGLALLKREGRRIANYIARALSTFPRADIMGSAPSNPTGDAFPTIYTGGRRW